MKDLRKPSIGIKSRSALVKMNHQKIFDTCDKIIRYTFYVLIYFLPISIALVEIFASTALVAFFVKRGFVFHQALLKKQSRSTGIGGKIQLFLQSYKPQTTYLNWPIGIFILMNAFSVVFSQNLELSIKGFFFKLLQGAYLYFNFVEAFKTRKQLQIFIIIFLVSASLMGVDSIIQLMTGKSLIYGHPLIDGRVTAAFKHPNDFGSYLVVVFPLLLGIFFLYGAPHTYFSARKNKRSEKECSWLCRTLLLGVVILTLVCLGLTLSRGAWLGAFAALAFLALKFRRLLPLLLILGIVFWFIFIPRIAAIRNVSMLSDDVSFHKHMDQQMETEKGQGTASMPLYTGEEAFVETASRQMGRIRDFSGMGRKKFWNEAWMMIKGSPILGTGLNTYSNIAVERKINHGGYAHNCYLQMASEIGILGLLAFLWIVGAIYRNACCYLQKVEDQFLYAVSAGILAGLTGFLVHIAVDTALYSVQLGNFLWVIFGILVTAQRLGGIKN